MRALVGVCALAAVLQGINPSSAAELRPLAACAVVTAPPRIDGDLDDAAWREATVLSPFVTVGTHRSPSQQVVCRVARSPERLYVAFECFEDNIPRIATNAQARDSDRAWTDDCVQVFIAPTDPRDVYYRVIVTAANVVRDERVVEAGQDRQAWWDATVESQTRLLPDRWTCELSLVLADFHSVRPLEGSWAFNVARTETPHSEWSSWSPLNAGFHELDHFGRLVWAEEPVVTSLDLPEPFIGRNEFRISLGETRGPCVAELHVLRKESTYTKAAARLGARSRVSQAYSLQEEGEGAVRLTVRRQGGQELLYATPAMAFKVPVVRSRAQQLSARANSVARGLGQLKDRAAAQELAAQLSGIRRECQLLLEGSERLRGSVAQRRALWDELADRVRALGPKVRIIEHRLRLGALGTDKLPSFGVGTESSLRKLAPDDSDYNLVPELQLKCARQERESGQIVVASLGEAVRGLTVDWGDLTGPKGSRLSRDHITISRVGYVTTRPPLYPVERVGRWPDPLMPLDSPIEIAPGELCPLWVTVAVPADCPPGEYTGTVQLGAADGSSQEVALKVEVWDLQLPLRGRFRTGFGAVLGGEVSVWYGLKGDVPTDFRRKFMEVLLNNRVNPAGLYVRTIWPPWEDLQWCRDRGMNALCLGNLGNASPERLHQIAADAERLRALGWLDMAYVYGFGGDTDADIERAREGFSRLQRAVPGLRRACPVAPIKPLWGYVNIWGALPSEYDHVSAQRRRYLGEEVWWYVCCGPRHPYQNFFIDYPATDARTLFWACRKYGVTGFFYYEVAMWASNLLTRDIGDPSIVIHEDQSALAALRAGKRWPEVPWNTFTFSRYNGDGQLIYPGPNETPLPSLRLEVIRDGIEDYELLTLLEELARSLMAEDGTGQYSFLVEESMRLASVPPEVVTSLTEFTDSPEVIATQRERVAAQALRLQRVLAALRAEKMKREG